MTPNSLTKAPAETAPLAGKYLTVELQGEPYGIPILSVREIIRMPRVTAVPQMPPWVSGVINLRGRIVAIADLRTKFGLQAETGERTCVVVVQVARAGRRIEIGLIVDAVEEVATVSAGDVESTPEFGTTVCTEYLLGIAKTKGRVCMLLDINRVVTGESLAQLASLSA